MSRAPDMRSPATRANAEDRAEVVRNDLRYNVVRLEPKADLAALYLARRFGPARSLARIVTALAAICRRCA